MPGLGRSLGEGKGYPLHCSGLENSTDLTPVSKSKSMGSQRVGHDRATFSLSHFHSFPTHLRVTGASLRARFLFSQRLLWTAWSLSPAEAIVFLELKQTECNNSWWKLYEPCRNMTLYSDLLLPLVVFAFPFTSASPSFNQRMGMGQQLYLPRKPGRAGEGVTEAPSKSTHRSRQPKDRTPPGQTHLSILFPLSLQIKPFYASEGVEKREPSYTVGGNVDWCSHYWRQYGISSKNQKKNYHRIQQFCPGYVSRKNGNINSKRYSPVIIAILFTTRKTRMQPKCPSTDEWIKEMWYTYINGILVIKKTK